MTEILIGFLAGVTCMWVVVWIVWARVTREEDK